jgi:hypothetical protein
MLKMQRRLATCCVADWQSAGRSEFAATADCQSAIRQTASLRYGGDYSAPHFKICFGNHVKIFPSTF